MPQEYVGYSMPWLVGGSPASPKIDTVATIKSGSFDWDARNLTVTMTPRNLDGTRNTDLARMIALTPEQAARVMRAQTTALLQEIKAMPEEELERQNPGMGKDFKDAILIPWPAE